VSFAVGVAVRSQAAATMEYPSAPYIENIGIRPDIAAGHIVEGFTAAMVSYIRSKMP
jgi:hypothetical protein